MKSKIFLDQFFKKLDLQFKLSLITSVSKSIAIRQLYLEKKVLLGTVNPKKFWEKN